MYMSNLDVCFTVVCITETWLNNANVNSYELPGYQHEFDYCKNKIGGGVSIFIKHNVEYRTRTDLNISNKFIESLFIEIPKTNITGSKNDVVVGVVYRPPDTDINVFTMYIKKILSTLKHESKIVYITGDFNIILLNIDKHIPSSEFVETMYAYSFFPSLINQQGLVEIVQH